MPTNTTWFPEQAFSVPPGGGETIPLQTQNDAVSYLRTILKDPYGARSLFGGPGSGKSTITQQFLSTLASDLVVAHINGSRLGAEEFLASVLDRFGYSVDITSAEDLLRMLSVFAVQQTRTCQPPIVVVENLDDMQPVTLRTLCQLASLTFQGRYAVRIVVTGGHKARAVLESTGMATLSKRLESGYDLEPLSCHESMLLLHGRLKTIRVSQPDSVLPMDVCDRIHELSAGNPGRIHELARGTLKQALSLPVTVSDVNKFYTAAIEKRPPPKLIVSLDGEKLETIEFTEKKVVIGRSSLADIVIRDDYASKFHAMLLLYRDALVLVDLKSSNGTLVNSIRVESTVLRSDDIISLANYRIKVIDAPEATDARAVDFASADTAKMKTLQDMREERKAKFSLIDVNRGVKHR